MKNKLKTFYILSISGLVILSACKKLIEVDPPITSITNASVYTNDANAISVLTGVYANMSNGLYPTSIYNSSIYLGLYSDEFSLFLGSTGTYPNYYTNNLISSLGDVKTPGPGTELWQTLYGNYGLYQINEAINGLLASNTLTPSIKNQLLGEAKFMRAFDYFYLVNLYGDVPLILGTDYKQNAKAPNTPQTQIWQQIKTDLIDAQSLLNTNYYDGTLINVSTERVRPNKWVATALLARVYLFLGDWSNAAAQATLLIDNTAQFGLNSLDNAFLRASKGNKEAIWQLQPVYANSGVSDAFTFVLTTAPSDGSVWLSNNLLNSFEPGDQRKVKWTSSITDGSNTYYFPYKYKQNGPISSINEFLDVFRLSEQYLIRAEAEANGTGTGINGAIADLNIIRTRAGLSNYNGVATVTALMAAIIHERQVEFFSEQGLRWLDLKRTGLAKIVMPAVTSQKGGTWADTKLYFPVPNPDLLGDPNLKQNPGY